VIHKPLYPIMNTMKEKIMKITVIERKGEYVIRLPKELAESWIRYSHYVRILYDPGSDIAYLTPAKTSINITDLLPAKKD